MADKKPKLPTVTSPRGVFQYPYLNKPDDKFAKEGEKGDYKLSAFFETGAAGSIIERIEEAVSQKLQDAKAEYAKKFADLKAKGEVAKAKKMAEPKAYFPFEHQLDADEEPTGKTKMNFKVNAEGKNAAGETWSNKPPVFDAAKKEMAKPVYGGSEGKVSFQIVPFYNASTGDAGVTLRLKAVQVLKLITKGSGATADAYGFGDEEGYEDEGTAADAFDTEDADDATTDEVEF